jgi:hypothetical protein
MADKLPYRLTINLKSFRPDAIKAALSRLDDLCSEHDQAGALTTKVVIESNDEQSLSEIRNQFEVFLRAARTLVEGEITIASPLVRPQPKSLPMDAVEGFKSELSQFTDKYGPVTLSHNGTTVNLTAETAESAVAMLQEDDDA